jgi:hypothetical protein
MTGRVTSLALSLAECAVRRPALVNGAVGVVLAPREGSSGDSASRSSVEKIVQIDRVTDPVRLRQFDLAALND